MHLDITAEQPVGAEDNGREENTEKWIQNDGTLLKASIESLTDQLANQLSHKLNLKRLELFS